MEPRGGGSDQNAVASLSTGLAAVLVVAVVLVAMDVSLLALLPLIVAGVFLAGLLVRERRA